MKNLFKTMMLVAAAMSVASCSEDAADDTVAPAPARQTKTITVNADLTRTQFATDQQGGTDRTHLVWSANDSFGVYTDVGTDKNIWSGYYSFSQEYQNGEFKFEVSADATEIYAYYPYYGSNNDNANTAVDFGITDYQKWAGPGVLTGSSVPMVASGTIEGSSVSLSFEQLGCVLALNVYGGAEGETLKSIRLTTREPSCGYADINIAADPVVFVPTANRIDVTPINNAEPVIVDAAAVDDQQNYPNQVYIVVAKKEYQKGAEFVVTTSEKSYTFTTKASLDCTTADFKSVNLNLKNNISEATVDYTLVKSLGDINTYDTYIIAGNNAATYAENATMWVWSGTINADASRLNCVEYTANGEILAVRPSTVGEIKIEVAGTSDVYYFKVGDKYLYNNGVGTTFAISSTRPAGWTVSDDWKDPHEGVYFYSNSCWVFCNRADETALGAYVGSDQYNGIYFFKKVDPNAPQIDITSQETISAAIDGGPQTITYNITNPNAEWSVGASVPSSARSWITNINTSVSGEISFNVEKNAGLARSAVVTVTYGPFKKTIKVEQAGVEQASFTPGTYFNSNVLTQVEGRPFDLDSNVSIVFEKGIATKNPQANNTMVRMYPGAPRGNTLTISAKNGKTISKVTFVFASKNNSLSVKDGSLSKDKTTWTGSRASIVFTCESMQPLNTAEISSITVTYE